MAQRAVEVQAALVAVNVGLGGRVPEADRGGEGRGVEGGDVGPTSVPGKEGGDRPGQLPCVGVPSGAYGMVDGRGEHRVHNGESVSALFDAP
ncbi:hypothetical protein SLUN_38250 [Streptomyces lunaelactis]|uniref:Uncharacterized protein n=1 Tax=Streptomyces lunaelactis TaxID=1535768 RepID=A0A2R4TDG4_9ACTN|nr:hypothetical protein SLUN_38250 [Streptomyces lunaelactis]